MLKNTPHALKEEIIRNELQTKVFRPQRTYIEMFSALQIFCTF